MPLFRIVPLGIMVALLLSTIPTQLSAKTPPKSAEDAASPSDLPPAAKPGECFVQVKQAAKFKEVMERVMVRPETEYFKTVPAVFKDVEKKVMISPEMKRYEIVEAKVEKKKVKVTRQPEYVEITETPPKFERKEEIVQIQPARSYWKRGAGVIGGVGETIGEVWCLVNEPAVVAKYVTEVVSQKASVKLTTIPAVEEEVETEVVVTPASVKEIVIPAQFKTIKVKELVSPAKEEKVTEPAKFEMVKLQVLVEPEKVTWVKVLCETNVSEQVLKDIQQALAKKGFGNVKPTGKFDDETVKAVREYEEKHQLAPVGLSYELLQHLGVSLANSQP